jgi:hypothetical protein
MNPEAARRNAEILRVLEQAKRLARRYRALTGKPLGVTGEVAEFEAAKHLDLELVAARQAGYDAVERAGASARRLSIKGRCVLPGASRSQRIGRIDMTKPFDAVLLVLMDDNLNATAIYEASRRRVRAALAVPGSKARNERGALPISKFKQIGRRVWARDDGQSSPQGRRKA